MRWIGGMVWLTLSGCEALQRAAVSLFSSPYEAREARAADVDGTLKPVFDGADASRPRLAAQLSPVASGFSAITDVQFPPGDANRMVVLEKGGKVWALQRDGSRYAQKTLLLDVDVVVASEQGLLGMAFHPEFQDNGRIFLHYVVGRAGGDYSEVAEWTIADPNAATWSATPSKTILTLLQPYANHNAGQVIFGPDGMLYVGFGDGGWRDDPHQHGQNSKSWLGSMLRIDVDRSAGEKHYAIPADNPFRENASYAPETWATGLRNPWRYSFDGQGRMIVADVGQNTYEEVDIVTAGANLGWNVREGRHCFPPSESVCPTPGEDGIVDPIYEYPHAEGTSITGGYVVQSVGDGPLNGKYVFGDFTSGRIWALELPAETRADPPMAPVMGLGRFGVLISTFGRDADGHVYVADYQKGTVYRIEAGGI